jgi:hypothetical protein
MPEAKFFNTENNSRALRGQLPPPHFLHKSLLTLQQNEGLINQTIRGGRV